MRHRAEPSTALARSAAALARRTGMTGLPSLVLFTDPARTPDPAASASRLPEGSAVVYRAFGDPTAAVVGRALRAVCDGRGVLLLVGADERLAYAIGADGLHLPERMLGALPRLRARRPDWLLTAAAHGPAAARRGALGGADAVFVSPVFPSRSPSARRPLGPLRLAQIVRVTPCPVLALGGVDARTSARLGLTGAVGIGAVEALA